MHQVTWQDILSAPCFLLNMDRSSDRLPIALSRIQEAGFQNIVRFRGWDKDHDDLEPVWVKHGNPPKRDADGFLTNKGKQACALGHYDIWKKMIEESIPYAVVFEDDVLFHKDWKTLAPQFWKYTPRDFHVAYMGSSFDWRSPKAILKAPCYCTHAMIVTLDGAKFMYDLCLKDPLGTWTIDIMLRKRMESQQSMMWQGTGVATLNWYVWNGWPWLDPVALRSPKWQDRLKNSGLVFQDEQMGSFVNAS